MKVYQRLARAFKDEGTSATFGMMGDGNRLWLSELRKLGIKVHEVRHEGAGLGMADGWARVTGAPGVATTTCGPGVTQLATALVTASRARTPLVAFCGERPIADDEYNQRLDQAKFADACEAGFVRLEAPANADEAVRRAFYRARIESRPIMLSVPMDIGEAEFEDDDAYTPSTALLKPWVPYPDVNALAYAADMIVAGRKPVIVVGRGAMQSGAGEAVLRLAERIGALIATSVIAKTFLNECEYHAGISGQYSSRPAINLLQDADCVIGVGASLNNYTTQHGILYANARHIQIDSSRHVIMNGVRAVECYIQSDAKAGVSALENLLASRGFKSTGYRTPAVKEALSRQFEDKVEFPLDPGTVDFRKAYILLDQILPPKIGLVTGTGMIGPTANMVMHRQRELNLTSHFFGCIGQMLPVSIGAAVATNNKPLVLVDGDASTMMQIAEFETAVRYGTPLLVIVMNNEALGPEHFWLGNKKLDASAAQISTPDLGKVGVAMGGRGHLARTLEELRAATEEWLASPGPMMIDLRISRSVLPITYRRMAYGKDD